MPKTTPQAAALALKGGLICLVTSRSGERWVVPKGRIERDQTPAGCAANEAYEEAGLIGTVDDDPLGTYDYSKDGKSFHVTVYALRDPEELDVWPECEERAREWVTPADAIERIRELGLRAILAAACAVG